MEQTLKDERMHPNNMVVGVAFIKGLPKRKALDCLESKRGRMQKLLRHLLKVNKQEGRGVSFPLVFVVQSALDHLRLGIKQIDGLIRQIGKLRSWK